MRGTSDVAISLSLFQCGMANAEWGIVGNGCPWHCLYSAFRIPHSAFYKSRRLLGSDLRQALVDKGQRCQWPQRPVVRPHFTAFLGAGLDASPCGGRPNGVDDLTV